MMFHGLGLRMKTWTKQDVFSIVALFVLLSIRLPIADMVSNLGRLIHVPSILYWAENLRFVQDTTYYLYRRWAFLLVEIVIIANWNVLEHLNVDKFFLIIIVCSGLAYCRFFFWPTGWATALLSISILILFQKDRYKFGSANPIMSRIILIILGGFFLGLWYISRTLSLANIESSLHSFLIGIPFIVIEEITFRGLLWMFLSRLQLQELKILIIQATLFWFFHINYMFAYPTLFWVIIPVSSILLGIIVWRSKSITPSTIAHILTNVLLSLITTS